MYKFITFVDYIVAIFYLFIILLSFYSYGQLKYKNTKTRRYFVLGISCKLIGSIIIGLLSQYYFKGGDTYYHFKGATSYTLNFFFNFEQTIRLLFNDASYNSQYIGTYFTEVVALIYRDSSLLVMKIGGILGLFSFNTYLGTSLLLATFSFLGTWKIFRIFSKLYPTIQKQIAIATLFIPTSLLWGGGYSKDSIVMGALGFLFFGCYQFFIERKRLLKNGVIIFLTCYLVFVIKVYILLAFLPAMGIWIMSHIKNKIKNKLLRKLSLPFIAFLLMVVMIVGYQKLQSVYSSFALDNIGKQIEHYQKGYALIKEINSDVNNFSIGYIEPTPMGMLQKFPNAVAATLFRPYLWEAGGNLGNLLSAIENSFFLFFTIWVLMKRKIVYFFRKIFWNKDILFCLMFTLSFAFIVGISTANFGTLIRYKIPCLPFFLIGLLLINHDNRKKKLIRKSASR